jgi:hypothetical protein
MGYYQAGDYYRGGDGNYAAGGIFGSIGKFIGGVAKTVVKASPIGGVVAAALPNVFKPPVSYGGSFAPPMPVPGLGGTISRILPGGDSGYRSSQGYHWSEKAGKWVKNRHMNPLNIRALRRSGRRVKGFLKIASRLGALPVNRGKGKRLFKKKAR